MTEAEDPPGPDRPGLRDGEHRVAPRRVPAAGLAALRRIQRRVAGRSGLHAAAGGAVRRAAGDGALSRDGTASGTTGRSTRCWRRSSPATAEWGGRASPPAMAIVDWREVPTWTEFEILRDAFRRRRRSDGRLRSARAGVRERRAERAGHEDRSRSIVACSSTTSSRGPTNARRWSTPTAPGAVCVANTFRCKLAHKKAFFAVLTDPRNAALFSDRGARHHPRARAVDTRPGGHRDRARTAGEAGSSIWREARREQLVLKPNDEYGGKGVVLGWETYGQPVGCRVERGAGGSARDLDRAGAHPGAARDLPAVRRCSGRVTMRDMLVDFAPYLFRGRMGGYLTRLSATGLANVTSGGGQVPAFVVGGLIA